MVGLLGVDEEKMRRQAQQAGLLSAGLGMIAASGPSRMPQGILQPVATGLLAGQQAYQGAIDQQIQNQVNAAKFAEVKRKMDMQKMLPSLYEETTDAQGNVTRQINRQKFQEFALQYPDMAKTIAETQISSQKAGLTPRTEAQQISPFAPYLQAESPQVRTLAQQYDRSFQSGVIDEETALKRLQPLAEMENRYFERRRSEQESATRAAEGKKPTQEERNAAGFADRMSAAEQQINQIESKIATSQAAGQKVGEPYATGYTQFMGGLPFVGEYARNRAMTNEQRQYRQAQENWVRANLRKESGAVIGADEMDREIAVYFPMPNDDPMTIQQKKLAREVTMNSMRKAAGKAYEPFDLEAFKKSRGLQ